MLISNCKFILLKNIPIFTQLQLEEALLRNDTQNWCLINTDVSPSIVLGISGDPKELLFIDHVKQDNIPIIKRFSGGGTVFVEQSTIFITWIINNVPGLSISPFAENILTWAKSLYQNVFPKNFLLKDNDYCILNKKIGGNALYIQKNRWLLHSSFLWDFNSFLMNRYLKLPKQQPSYRQHRNHNDFLEKLNNFYNNKQNFIFSLESYLKNKFKMTEVPAERILNIINSDHRKTTQLLSL